MNIEVVAFDADDTLWHNETLFAKTKQKFVYLLSPYCPPEKIEHHLDSTEIRNLTYFGYGIKGFTLSMIETAIELTDGQIEGRDIQRIIDFGKTMLTTPVRLLENVQSVLERLSKTYRLLLITKGDLFDQESKVARSGLSRYFTNVEILSEKDVESYRAVLAKYEIAAERFLMVGNSLRSDILPVLEIGAHAVYIPHQVSWSHENTLPPTQALEDYSECDDIGKLPELLKRLCAEDRSER